MPSPEGLLMPSRFFRLSCDTHVNTLHLDLKRPMPTPRCTRCVTAERRFVESMIFVIPEINAATLLRSPFFAYHLAARVVGTP